MTKRLWIARGRGGFDDDIFFSDKKMEQYGRFIWVGEAGSLCNKTVSPLTGLKLKPGQQIECKVTETKKGFKVEKV